MDTLIIKLFTIMWLIIASAWAFFMTLLIVVDLKTRFRAWQRRRRIRAMMPNKPWPVENDFG